MADCKPKSSGNKMNKNNVSNSDGESDVDSVVKKLFLLYYYLKRLKFELFLLKRLKLNQKKFLKIGIL